MAVEEVRRLQRYGLTKGELERYSTAILRDSAQLAEQANKVGACMQASMHACICTRRTCRRSHGPVWRRMCVSYRHPPLAMIGRGGLSCGVWCARDYILVLQLTTPHPTPPCFNLCASIFVCLSQVPSLDTLNFVMESLACGHTVMGHREAHEAMVAVAASVSLEEINTLARYGTACVLLCCCNAFCGSVLPLYCCLQLWTSGGRSPALREGSLIKSFGAVLCMRVLHATCVPKSLSSTCRCTLQMHAY